MATALVVVPAIDVFVTRACLRFLKPPEGSKVLVVNNTAERTFSAELFDAGLDVCDLGSNIGVAASWNKGYERVMADGFDYLIVSSASMLYLQGMRDLIGRLPAVPANPVVTGFGWHCKPLPRQQLADVGAFDERFHPAYAEDTDYEYRSALAGWGGGVSVPVSAIDLGDGHGAMRVACDVPEMVRRYAAKWGGPPGQETLREPAT